MFLLPAVAPSSSAYAAHRVHKKQTRVVRPLLPSPEKDAAIVVDGATGKILYARNPDATRYPASLTKMMTLYLLFDALEKGKISLDTPLITSTHAAEQQPTKLAMGAGASIPVETAIKAITVLSANDVAVVIAEALGGSEENFASMMTAKARELGMMHTNFHNASGLPDLQQLTTARDMAILGRHLAYDFPQYFQYFSAPGFTYKGRSYSTHDNLLATFDGTDGIKTGYTQLSGFNLVTSTVRDNKHVVGVVMGGPTAAVRDREMMRLLSAAFETAKDDPTMLADANVPWHGGKGPGGELFKADPGGDDTLLLTALDPKSRFRAKSRTAPPVLAAAETGSANVVPIPKPATLALADAADAQIIPALTEDTPIIEALQHDPLQSPPLRLSQGPVLRMDSAVTELAQGDGSDSSPAPVERQANDGVVKRWAVQIGAFASEALAQAKLATFAQRGFDIIGQAQKLIVPFTSGSGQILYRARLGMFGESEARDICRRMTQRGESCFAALSDAG